MSNGRGQTQRAKLQKLAIAEYFDAILISEELGVRKPEPAIYEHLARALRCLPQQIVFVGDQPELDILAPLAGGMRAVWISRGTRWPLADPPPPTIASVLEIESVLEHLELSQGRT